MNPLEHMKRFPAFLLAGAALLLTGCDGVRLRVAGVAPMNLTDDGRSAPMDLRFFQLADDDRFLRASFEALWLDPAKALGSDLLARPVCATVLPAPAGEAPQAVELGPRADGARFVGVMALCRREDGSPRTLALPLERCDAVLEVTGYGLRERGAPPPRTAPREPPAGAGADPGPPGRGAAGEGG
jgi:type VI secretion system VasD/TssJ family lipoprotein